MRRSGLSVPAGIGIVHPAQLLVVVAAHAAAAVWRAERETEIEAGNAQAVVEAVVDAHIGPARHMTLDTEVSVTWFALMLALVELM
jgi:hypothetical protein